MSCKIIRTNNKIEVIASNGNTSNLYNDILKWVSQNFNDKSLDYYKDIVQERQDPITAEEVSLAVYAEALNKIEEQFANPSNVNYQPKAFSIIMNNINKIVQWENNKSIDEQTLWKKVGELGIPKLQLELLKQSEGSTIEEKLASFMANYSYTIKIDTAKEKYEGTVKREISYMPDYLDSGPWVAILDNGSDEITEGFQSKEEAEEYMDYYYPNVPGNTRYYSYLTVPGGTNYTENEIATPAITPSIKGHAEFATDKGIGWFRSDEKRSDDNSGKKIPDGAGGLIQLGQIGSKTRRILEVQSDLFQKGRDKTKLTKNIKEQYNVSDTSTFYDFEIDQTNDNTYEVISKLKLTDEDLQDPDISDEEKKLGYSFVFFTVFDTKKEAENFLKLELTTQDQFLQLLNKDNNWVTFFVKSIIQDSAKKGYEKVLFPSGNTASKIEGHTTLEEFKKQKEDRIKELEKQINEEIFEDRFGKFYVVVGGKAYETKKEALKAKEKYDTPNKSEINQLKEELERVDKEGFGALMPIFNFYENAVANVLKKQGFNPILITDEYGNTWQEITISNISNFETNVENIQFQLSTRLNPIITDANGEPQLFYHGTSKSFEKFNKLMTGYGGQVEDGFYFTTDLEYAKTYGENIHAVYLKGEPKQIDKPIFRNVVIDEFFKDPTLETISGIDQQTNKPVMVVRHPDQIIPAHNQQLFLDRFGNIHDANQDLNPVILEQLNQFFKLNGFTVQQVSEILTRANTNANASIDFLNQAVRFVDGRSNALSEEAAHLLLAMLPDSHSLMANMMSKIQSFKTYDQVLATYGSLPEYQLADGSVNLDKIAKEAIGQVIGDIINGSTIETKETQKSVLNFLNKLIEYLRQFLLGKSDAFEKMIEPFAQAKDLILGGYTGEVLITQDVYYNVSSKQQEVLNKLKATQIKLEGKTYEVNGKKVKYRVSNLVDKLRRQIFKYASELPQEKKDFLSEKGTLTHFYLSSLFSKSYTKDELVNLAKKELDFNRPSDFYELPIGIYNELVSKVKKFKESITVVDPNAVILTEQMIYDSSRDIAGTVDILVVHSDGRVSIYDFKNIEYLTKKNNITLQSYRLYEKQLSEYKRILRNSYGVSAFSKSRIIPIDVSYDGNSYGSLTIGSIESKESYLKPLPVAAELTEDSKVNRTLDKMIRRRGVIVAELGLKPENDDLRLQYAKLNKAILALQRDMDFTPILTDLISTSRYINKNIDSFTISDAFILNQYLSHFELYENFIEDFDTFIHDSISDFPKEEQAKFMSEIKTAMVNAVAAKSMIIDKLVELYSDRFESDLTQGGKVKSDFAALFLGKDNFENPIFKAYYQIIRNNRESTRLALNDLIKRIEPISKNIIAKYGADVFDKYIIDENGDFVRPYTYQFTQDRKYYRELYINGKEKTQSANSSIKAEGEKEVKEALDWASKNLEFDNVAFDDRLEKFKLKVNNPLSGYTTDLEKQSAIKKYESLSPINNDDAWFMSSFVKVGKPEDKYIPEKWKVIQRTPDIKEYVDMYIQIMGELRNATNRSFNTNYFIPEVEKDLIDKITSGGISLGQYVAKQLDVLQTDEVYGVHDENGQQLKTIPVLYTTPIKGRLSVEDRADIKQQVLAKGIKENSLDYESEFETLANELIYKKGKKLKSHDLTSNLILFAQSALSYKFNNDTLDMVLNLRHILKERQTVFQTNRFNLDIVDANTQELVPIKAANTNTLNQFDLFLEYDYYGIKMRSKDKQFNVNGNTISASKIVQGMMTHQSIVNLAFNPAAGFANAFNAQYNLKFLQAEGIYFTKENFTGAIVNYTDGSEEAKMITDLFEINSKGEIGVKADKQSSRSKAKTFFSMRTLFSFHRIPDDHLKNVILIALSKNYILDSDGKVKSKTGFRVKDPNAKTLYELVTKDGITGLSHDEFSKFRAIALNVASKVIGSVSEDQLSQIDTTIGGKILTKFKRWMPALIQTRLGDLRVDPLTDEFEVGRFRVFIGEIIGNGFLPAVKALTKELARAASMGMYNPSSNDEITKKYFETVGKKIGIENFEDFKRLREAKLKSMAYEVRMWLVLLILVQMAAGFDWDDDDSSFFSRLAYRMLNRTYKEMSFFFDPNSAVSLVKSPIAIAKQLSDIERIFENMVEESLQGVGIIPENTRDQSPMLYYTLKQVPGVNHILEMGGFYKSYQERMLIDYIFPK